MSQNLHPNSRCTCPVCGAILPPLEAIAHLYSAHPADKWEVTLTFVSPAGAPDEDNE